MTCKTRLKRLGEKRLSGPEKFLPPRQHFTNFFLGEMITNGIITNISSILCFDT